MHFYVRQLSCIYSHKAAIKNSFKKLKQHKRNTHTQHKKNADARNRYRLDKLWAGRTSLCLSVRHTLVLYQNGWTYCHVFSPHDSPFILVLCVPRSSRNFDGVTPRGGAKYRWGIKISRFSSNKSLYLTNDTRYRHGCYGRRIGYYTQLLNGISFNDLERPQSVGYPADARSIGDSHPSCS